MGSSVRALYRLARHHTLNERPLNTQDVATVGGHMINARRYKQMTSQWCRPVNGDYRA